jgi:molecular chaperone GrpE
MSSTEPKNEFSESEEENSEENNHSSITGEQEGESSADDDGILADDDWSASYDDSDDGFSKGEDESAQDSGDDSHTLKIKTLEEELDRAKDQMMRALADAENTRKRAQKDRTDIAKYAISSFAKDMLDFAGNFRRAIESLPKDAEGNGEDVFENIVSGLEAMERDMLSTFEKHGITKIEPLDEMFDPNFHEVMFETPTTDSKSGTILQVIEPGYILENRLLKAARVAVARNDSESHDDPSEPGSHIDQKA